MANIKISELNALEKADKEDLLVIVDNSENETKKIAIEDLNIGSTDVVISPDEPTTDDWKIWIDSDEVGSLGSEVVNSLDGNETTLAPSVKAVNDLVRCSTDEINTGKKWIDGKQIYRKVIEYNQNFTADTWNDCNFNENNINEIIKIFVRARFGNNIWKVVPVIHNDNEWNIYLGDISNTSVALRPSTAFTGDNIINKVVVIIEYTKTTD